MSGPMTKQIADKQAKRRRALNALYDLLTVGVEERDFTDGKLADVVGDIPPGTIKDYTHTFAELGIVERRLEYGGAKNGLRPGRHFHWTLLLPRDVAHAMLDSLDKTEVLNYQEHFREGVQKHIATKQRHLAAKTNGTAQTAIRVERDTPVEAIAGPEPINPFAVLAPLRRDEAYALVEAARQYKTRDTKMDERIQALLDQARELGMEVDEAALRSSIAPVKQDERLDAVALVLPYIEGLERTIANLERIRTNLQDAVKDAEKMRRDMLALREQNQRLLARQVVHN